MKDELNRAGDLTKYQGKGRGATGIIKLTVYNSPIIILLNLPKRALMSSED